MTNLAGIMEGTHTILELHRPIMELCYVSFYLPEGQVRGFTYKHCVTLDRASKRFCDCYQVRERSEVELGERAQENFGDLYFKPTATKDILIELFKLTAEKEKLLSTLLRSHHILGNSKGNQQGKLQNVSRGSKLKGNDKSSFMRHQELLLDSTNQDNFNHEKSRKYRRKENFEESRQRKGKRKVREHPPLQSEKDMQMENEKFSATFPTERLSSTSSASGWLTIKDKDDLTRDMQPERWIKEGYFLKSNKPLKLDADISGSVSKSNTAVAELLDCGESIPKVRKVQQDITLENLHQYRLSNKTEPLSKSTSAKRLKGNKCTEQGCKEKPAVGAVAKAQHSGASFKEVVRTHAEPSCDFQGDKATASPVLAPADSAFVPGPDVLSVAGAAGASSSRAPREKERDDSALQYKGERVPAPDESWNLVGAVNKALLKVIRSDSLDEAAEWKRLQQIPRADRNLPASASEKRAAVSWGSSKHLFLNLPVNECPDISQTSKNLKLEEKRLPSPSLVAVSNAFSNSYPLSNSHKQMSPIPSPLSSRLPSPQLHHRILPLPAQNREEESMFSDYCGGRHAAINLSFNDLEPQFYLKFSDPGDLGFAIRQPGLHQNASARHFERRALQEKLPAQTQLHFRPGIPAETALKDERLASLDVANRDEDSWALDYRLGQSSAFTDSSEKEKINRNILHLSLELNEMDWSTESGRRRPVIVRKLILRACDLGETGCLGGVEDCSLLSLLTFPVVN
ncbi:formin-1-like [Eudromia elegans]